MGQPEKNCRWNFSPRVGGIDQGPNDAMGDTFKKLPYQALVREAIQNSLDAAISDDRPVIVTFKHSHVDTQNYPQLFGLRKHIKACLEFYNSPDAKKRFKPMLDCINDARNANCIYYLRVSDENTRGMAYRKGSTSSPFYAFVKSIGNSVKDNKAKGGSKGYGKAAYFNASQIRTVLISSLTESGQYVFEGVSGLCTHMIDGQKREHYGFYTDATSGNQEEPVTDKENIPVRFCRDTIGTSAYILGVDYSSGGIQHMKMDILKAVLLNFWAAILEHRLEVRIAIEQNYTINAENLFEWAETHFETSDDSKTVYTNPRPYMDAFHNVGKDFNHMKFEKKMPTLGKVELFLTRTKTGTDNFLCMRSPLMTVKSWRYRTNYGFYGVFICRDEKGNEILRTMEEGSHTQWDYKNCDDMRDREEAKKAEAEIKEFLDECIAEVFHKGNVNTLTFGGLEEFLSIPSSLDDEETFAGDTESDFGAGNGDRTDNENSEITTDIDDEEDGVSAADDPEGDNGQVIIYEGSGGMLSSDGGETEGGNEPGKSGDGPGGGENGDQGGSAGGHGGNRGDDGDSGDDGATYGTGGTGGSNSVPGYGIGDGLPLRRTRLNVRYRAFAQVCSGGGYSHRLVINSSRASDNAIVQVMCAGESSNEAIAIKTADQGTWSGNVISNVKLQQGRNVINIWFDDDMRHSITLTVHED